MTMIAVFEPQPRIGARVERWVERLGLRVWRREMGPPDGAVVCVDGDADWSAFLAALPEGLPVVATMFRDEPSSDEPTAWSSVLRRPFNRADLADALNAAGLSWDDESGARATADYATTADHERAPSVTPVAGVDVVVDVDDADFVDLLELDPHIREHALTGARLVDFWATLDGTERVDAIADFLASVLDRD